MQTCDVGRAKNVTTGFGGAKPLEAEKTSNKQRDPILCLMIDCLATIL
jgi:hypothetical protein